MIQFNQDELIGASYEQPCILLGEPQTFKTAILLHYGYLQTKRSASSSDQAPYGIVICSQTKLDKEDRLIFGRGDYKISLVAKCADRMKMKYIENFSDLCKFLSAFYLIENAPQYVFIDDLNYYVGVDHKRIAYVMFLLKNIASAIHKRAASISNNNTKNSSKGSVFHVMATWLTEELQFTKEGPQMNEQFDPQGNHDINLSRNKQLCLVLRNYTPNIFQIIPPYIGSVNQQLSLFKISQDYETLKMHKSLFSDQQFKEIFDHINSL